MSSELYINIRGLVNVREDSKVLRGNAMSELPVIDNAYLIIEDGVIAGFGTMEALRKSSINFKNTINVSGQWVLPAWCDSHTHLVFSGSREEEFVAKIKGKSYSEIAASGGGILHSAKRISSISEDVLFNQSWKRLIEVSKLGTAAIEIKSGYGLSVENELKMLRVIKKLKERSNLVIKSTFLGAHTYPVAFKDHHEEYIRQIIEEMLPVIGAEKLADFVDVFCEDGFFSPEETEQICAAAAMYGLKPKLHVNQINSIGGIQAGIKSNAVSLDHLETLTANEIEQLSNFKGLCTLLPTAAFFLRLPFQPARKLIESGCAVALASDYNPGSSPSGNMNFVISLSCIQMRMLPEEAINAATINGAYAMEAGKEAGSITLGKKANLIFTHKIPSLAYIPYRFGTNLIDRVMINGQFI